MSYDIYYKVFFIGGAVLAGVMLLLSVLLFFLLKIPHVLGDLTGANARRAIENIRNQNESSGDKVYKTSPVNRERGKITDKISPSGSLMRNPSGILGGAMATEKISTQELPPEETTVLDATNETTVLDTANETTVLNSEAGETTVLDAQPDAAPVFQIEYEITYIHSEEVIT